MSISFKKKQGRTSIYMGEGARVGDIQKDLNTGRNFVLSISFVYWRHPARKGNKPKATMKGGCLSIWCKTLTEAKQTARIVCLAYQQQILEKRQRYEIL